MLPKTHSRQKRSGDESTPTAESEPKRRKVPAPQQQQQQQQQPAKLPEPQLTAVVASSIFHRLVLHHLLFSSTDPFCFTSHSLCFDLPRFGNGELRLLNGFGWSLKISRS